MKKTEHVGPKRGCGAYWGFKREAKRDSNKTRRVHDVAVVVEHLKFVSAADDLQL